METFNVINPNFVRIFIARVFFSTSHSLLLVALPLILAAMGSGAQEIGAVMGAFGLGVLLGRPLVTWLLHHNSRKFVVWIGAVIFAVGPILYYWYSDATWYWYFRLFQGFGFSALFTATLTMVIDQAPASRRGQTLGYLGLSHTTVLVVGPLIAVELLDRFGADVVFLTSCFFSVVGLCLVYFVQEFVHPESAKAQYGAGRSLLRMEILMPTLLLFFIAIVHGAIFFFLPLFVKTSLGQNGGIFFTCFGLSSIAMRLFSGRYSDQFGRRPVALAGLGMLLVGSFLVSQIDSLGILVLAACFYGGGFGGYMPAMTAFVSDRTTVANRAAVIGLYFSAFDMGNAVSGWVMGTLAAWYGIPVMFQYAAGTSLLSFLLFAIFLAPRTRKTPPVAPAPQIPEGS